MDFSSTEQIEQDAEEEVPEDMLDRERTEREYWLKLYFANMQEYYEKFLKQLDLICKENCLTPEGEPMDFSPTGQIEQAEEEKDEGPGTM